MATYDAFISYSHAKDKPIAAALQRAVQRLGKPWYRRRALRVFRDDTSLSATPHLWPTIERALGESRYFILRRGDDVPKTFETAKKELEVSLRNRRAYSVAAELAQKVVDSLKETKDPQKTAQALASNRQGCATIPRIPVMSPPSRKVIARGNAFAKSFAGETTLAAMLTDNVATTTVNIEIATTTG